MIKNFIKKGVQLSIIAAVGLCVIYFLYPITILQLYGKEIPNNWTQSLEDMSFREIYQKIGIPQDDVSAKGYQGWAVDHWWGKELLES